MEADSLKKFNSSFDFLSKSLDSINKISKDKTNYVVNSKMQIVSKGIFTKGVSIEEGIPKIYAKLIETIKTGQNLLNTDQRTKVLDKIKTLREKLHFANEGINNLNSEKLSKQMESINKQVEDTIAHFHRSLDRSLHLSEAAKKIEELRVKRPDLNKAEQLHIQFKKQYEENPATIDARTKFPICTIEQFKTATRMLKENYPDVDKKEEKFVATLLQTILTGKSFEPPNDKCFIIKELRNGITEKPLKPEKDDSSSLILHHFKTITTKVEENLKSAVHLFTADCLERAGNKIVLGKETIELGTTTKSPEFIKKVNEHYTDYLIKNPEQAKKIIESSKHSDLLNFLKGKDFNLAFEKNENAPTFPEKVLFQILENEMKSNLPNPADNDILKRFNGFALTNVITDMPMSQIAEKIECSPEELKAILEQKWDKKQQNIFYQLQEIIQFSRMDKEAVQAIAKKTSCAPNEIESLARLKILEMIILMNQSFLFFPSNEYSPLIMSYNSTESPGYNAETHSRTYEYTNDLNSLELTLKLDIHEQTAEKTVVAHAESKMACPSIDTFETEKPLARISPLQNLLVSWRTPPEFLDHLITSSKSSNTHI